MYKFTLTFLITDEYGHYCLSTRFDTNYKQTVEIFAKDINEAIEKARKIAVAKGAYQLRDIEWKAEEVGGEDE